MTWNYSTTKKILFLINILFLCFCIIPEAYADTNSHKIIMSYWSNANRYSYYPVPGSFSKAGEKQSNSNFKEQLNFINILAYAALAVNTQGIIHFKNSYYELSDNDMEFCLQNPFICIDNNNSHERGLGSFNAFAHLQNKNFTLQKIISIGGSNSDSSFNHAIAHINNFVTSVAAIVQYYHLTGVDLDFELQNPFTTSQAEKYADLISQLRQTLGPTKIISIEVPPDSQTQDSINSRDWRTIANNINYISLMGYEFHSYLYHPYITGFNSNLYSEFNLPENSDFYKISDDMSVKNLLALGIPAHKILLGIPAYTHTYGGVSSNNYGLYQMFNPAKTPIFDEFGKGITTYDTALRLLQKGFQQHEIYVHGVVSAVYAYNAHTRQFITYENPASILAKADYVLANNLAGAMVWNVAEDLPVNDNNSILAILNRKLNG